MPHFEPPHHHQPQRTHEVTEIQIRLHLSPKSANPKSRFYSRICTKEGFIIPTPCIFTTTSRDSNSFRILIKVSEIVMPEGLLRNEKPLSFHITSSLEKTSIACSKLNMAIALSCKVVARSEGNEVVFSITAPSKAIEDNLLKQFSIFEGKEYSSSAVQD